MGDYTEYDHTGQGNIYPLANPLKQGYGVSDPDINPASKQANGRFVNQRNEKIDFWIEEIQANFGMTGSTAQSRNVRQFFPHNINQPSITVIGRAPNSFQYNRIASFVRSSHWNAFHPGALGSALRHEATAGGQVVQVQTIRLVVRNGSNSGFFPYNGAPRGKGGKHRNVKGIHVPWALEGYVKSMKAGGQRFNQAPQFQFEFFVAESKLKPNLGIWKDTRVYGSELKPWLDWIKKDGGFVTVSDKNAAKSLDPTPSKDERESGNFNPGSFEDLLEPPGGLFEQSLKP